MMRISGGTTVDLVLIGKALIEGSFLEAAVAIDDGVIVGISKPSLAPNSVSRVEFGEKFLLLPGMVDIHVHMREPGLEYKEDWGSGSRAAVKGGVTMVVDMPNNVPPANNCSVLQEKLQRASARSLVDFAFYAGFNPLVEELERCRGLFVGFKLYPEDLYSPGARNVFSYASRYGLPVVVHAENPSLFRESKLHSDARPPEAEESAVRHALMLSRESNAWLHVTHLSTSGALMSVLEAKVTPGGRVTFDVTPHHCLLSDELYRGEKRGIAVVNPPLRPEGERASIYTSLRNMLPDAIVTDHAPHRVEEKTSEKPSPGFPGLETALHLLFREILEGRLGLEVLELYSRRPARLLGVKKGVLGEGFEGDVVVVSKEEWFVRGEDFESKAKYSPFEGWRLSTKTYAVYIRGEPVYIAGQFMTSKGGRLAVPRG